MNIEQIIKAQDAIKSEIIARSKNRHFDKGYILDGVCNLESYFSHKPRIAWILKESWDKEWGDWDICEEVIDKQEKELISRNPSFKRVAYVSYGVLKNLKWDNMPWIHETDDIINVLKAVAWLNISKIAGDSTSPDSRISDAYNVWNDILKKQLELYDPDIIILGNTHKWVGDMLEINGIEPIKVGSAWAYKSRQNKIVIWAFHPSCRKSDKTYTDDIIEAVNLIKEY